MQFTVESIQIASPIHHIMAKDSDKTKKETPKSVSNKELRAIILDIGSDLVDTLDSIHNAILTTRKEIKRLHERMEGEKPSFEKSSSLKLDISPDSDNEDDGHDHYSAYIG